MAVSVENEDIGILTRTYLQLFSSILQKRNIDTEEKRKIYKSLQTFLSQNIKTTDEFSNHIPHYAKLLSVSDKALSAYLGNNFQKALEHVKGSIPAGTDGGSAGAKITSSKSIIGSAGAPGFLEDLVRESGIRLAPGSRFIPVELGVLKLAGGGQETFGSSAAELLKTVPDAVTSETQPDAKPGPKIIKQTIPARSEKKAHVAVKEESIINEILAKFGNVLDIHKKLNPSVGPGEDAGPFKGESSADAGKSSAESSASAPVHEKPASIPVRSEKKVLAFEKEGSIINEILAKFGNVLDIHQKLTPQEGPPSESDSGSTGETSGEKSAEEEIPPIITRFQDYYGIIKKIREFQVKNDREGYNSWLGGADLPTRAVVGVRNANLKYQKGLIFDVEEELLILEQQLGFKLSSLCDLKLRIEQFEKIQILLGQLMEEAKGQGNVFINSFRPVWSQIQLIFDVPETLPKTQFALKKVLKKVASPAMRSAMEEIVVPHLKKAALIYDKSKKTQLGA